MKEDRVVAAKASVSGPSETSDRIKMGMLIQDPAKLRGTIVTKVRAGSVADAAGLKEGDRIVSVESKLLESGDRLRNIIAKKTWGDRLAMGIVRDGELISKMIKFEQPSQAKLAASRNRDNGKQNKAGVKASAESKQTSTAQIGKGIGSMLGGLFANNTAKKQNSPKQAEKVVTADAETTVRTDSEIHSDDPLGFGDDEPIEQVIFEERSAAPKSAER